MNTRHNVYWAQDSLQDYESLVSSKLPRIRELWRNSSSAASISIFLKTTNMVLAEAAKLCHKSVLVFSKRTSRSNKIPANIQRSNVKLSRLTRKLRTDKEKDADTRTFAEVFENCGNFLIVEDYAPLFSEENLFLVEMFDETFNILHIYSL